jgi:hypothetical protein
LPREDELETFDPPEELRRAGAATHGAPRRFEPSELVACEKCSRGNAPTRMNCLYCGASLPVDERSAALRRPSLRKLEEWERGFNVVLHPTCSEVAPETIEEAASLLRLESSRLEEIIGAEAALPVARAASLEEAELIVSRLAARGLAAEVFGDEDLARQPLRVRALSFVVGDALTLTQGAESEPTRVAWDEVALIVTGRVVNKRVEFEERPSNIGARARLVEARETVADEAVLDIHTTDDGAAGFRVMADNFDYSCLGRSKGLVAGENFKLLVEELRARAPRAAFDDSYARMRAALSSVWPPTERTESGGLRRDRPGRLNTESVTVVGNETQFTRYARLRRRLALRARAKSS